MTPSQSFFNLLQWDKYSSSWLCYLPVRQVARLSEVCRTTYGLLRTRRVSYIRGLTGDPTIPEEQARRVDMLIAALVYAQFPFLRRPPFALFKEGSLTQLDPFLKDFPEEGEHSWRPGDRHDLARRLILAGDRDLALKTAVRLIEGGGYFHNSLSDLTCKGTRTFLQSIGLFKVLDLDDDFYATVWADPTTAILEAFERNSFHALRVMAPLIIAMQKRRRYTGDILQRVANTLFSFEGFIDLDPELLLPRVISAFDVSSMDVRFIAVVLQIFRALNMPQEPNAFAIAIRTREFVKVELTLNCLLTAGGVPTANALQVARDHACSESILALIQRHIPLPTASSRKRKAPHRLIDNRP